MCDCHFFFFYHNQNEELYSSLDDDTDEWERQVYRSAKSREKKIRDSKNARCIKGQDHKVLSKRRRYIKRGGKNISGYY